MLNWTVIKIFIQDFIWTILFGGAFWWILYLLIQVPRNRKTKQSITEITRKINYIELNHSPTRLTKNKKQS